MKFNGQDPIEMLNQAKDKTKAIVELLEKNNEALYQRIIEEVKASTPTQRVFSEEEKVFYNKLIKQAVTFTQEDVIPTQIIDRTLASVKKASPTLKLVNFAPAGVQKWLTGAKTGTAVWGALTATIANGLTATISGMDINVNKLTALLVVPKAIRDLGINAVDVYFSAILAEAMHDGLCNGYINGDGKVAPIGITKKIASVETDSTHTAKDVLATVTGFTPKKLAPVLKTLSNGGLRAVTKLYVLAEPTTVYDYVNPALLKYNAYAGGYTQVAPIEVEVIEEPMVAVGKAIFTIEGAYTMGTSAIEIKEYKEVGALDDVDTFIAKCYGNGRADDDNTAVVIDATKLTALEA